MSIKLMTKVWDEAPAQGGSLLVLLAMADYANDDGVCYPSLNKLAERSRLGRRHVIRCIDELVGLGIISRLSRGGIVDGRHLATTYQFMQNWDSAIKPLTTGDSVIQTTKDSDIPWGELVVSTSPQPS